jgi:tetratricopeptide (TPR) repeat protein
MWPSFAAKRFAEAIEHYEYIVDTRPNALGPALNLGWCYLETDQPEKALDLINALHEHFPGYDLDARLGLCYLELDKPGEAQSYFTRALGKNAADPMANYGLGRVQLAQGNPSLAAQFFQAASGDPEWDKRCEPYRKQIAEQVLDQ